MKEPEQFIEIFLQPGEYFFGDCETRIRTLLGSCVSMTFWHPTKLIGGMNHIMLPSRGDAATRKMQQEGGELDGKYADESFSLMLDAMISANTKPSDYQVKLFGGGDMFSKPSDVNKTTTVNKPKIGMGNIEAAKNLLKQYGFKAHAEHVGGFGHRYIIFDIWNGDVWMKHEPKK